MRQSLLFAVAALSTFAQGAAVDKREDIEKRQANINIEPNGATVEVKTVAAGENIPGLSSNQNGIIAGILDALNGNKGNSGNMANQNCPPAAPPPPPVTVTKTVHQNASIPAPLTVFVTQAALPPVTVVVTQSCAPPPPPPPPPACPAPPPPQACPPPPACPAPAAPPAAATTPPTPPPVAAEPPVPVAAPPAASAKPTPLPFVGSPAPPANANPAAGSNPTTSLNLGGLNGAGGGANPAIPAPAGITAPAVANPAAAPNAVIGGLQLSSKLVLGNLLQQNALQARETPAPRAVDAEVEAEA